MGIGVSGSYQELDLAADIELVGYFALVSQGYFGIGICVDSDIAEIITCVRPGLAKLHETEKVFRQVYSHIAAHRQGYSVIPVESPESA